MAHIHETISKFIIDTITLFGENDDVVTRIYLSSKKYQYTDKDGIYDILSICLLKNNCIYCHVSNNDDTEQFFIPFFNGVNRTTRQGIVRELISLYNARLGTKLSNIPTTPHNAVESENKEDIGIVIDMDRLRKQIPNFYRIKKEPQGLKMRLMVGMCYQASYLKEKYPYFDLENKEYFEPCRY